MLPLRPLHLAGIELSEKLDHRALGEVNRAAFATELEQALRIAGPGAKLPKDVGIEQKPWLPWQLWGLARRGAVASHLRCKGHRESSIGVVLAAVGADEPTQWLVHGQKAGGWSSAHSGRPTTNAVQSL